MTALALLALLLAEGFCAGFAHRLCHRSPSDHAARDSVHQLACCPGTDDEPSDPDHHAPGQLPPDHDQGQCLACRMVAKQAVLANLLIAPRVAEVSEFVEQPLPTSHISSQITLPLSRAPPAVL
jgi:hypothetical protein